MSAVTAEQARSKWCPFVRVPYVKTGGVAGINRKAHSIYGPAALDGSQCIAAQCMAWRWLDTEETVGDRIGYCGLAGGLATL